ncbi:MAG: DUF3784 domain-containing protein, partial [bacterium]|nr:DUF3784 domain-containing protein [bacterium]
LRNAKMTIVSINKHSKKIVVTTMIFATMSPEKKKKINRVVVGIGLVFLVLGFLPGFISYQWGIILFVFSLVIYGIIKVIIPEPEPEINVPSEGEGVEKLLKSGEEENKNLPEL